MALIYNPKTGEYEHTTKTVVEYEKFIKKELKLKRNTIFSL